MIEGVAKQGNKCAQRCLYCTRVTALAVGRKSAQHPYEVYADGECLVECYSRDVFLQMLLT